MSPSHTSLLLLALLTLTASTSATPTIYDIVNQFGFPSGILPDSVTSYTTSADGDGFTFAISLKKPCYVKYDYLVHFDSTITGKITYGKITGLKGLTAQSFFFWLNIDEMTLNSNSITFTLGFVNVDLDIKQFETIPTCKDKALADCDHSSSLISKITSTTPTIYDIVNQFGFPSGILPDSVASYTTAADGDGFSFAISLKKPCYVKYDYLVHFDSTITGKITYGKITGLKGLTAQSFFFWLNIDEMTLNSDSITFTLGFVNVDLDIKQFKTIPTCKDKALADCDQSSSLISKIPITRKWLIE